MNFIQAIILSIVEGITEFLPISSTGHLILTSYVLGITQTEFVKSFEIVIQFGAIIAVVFLYIKTVIKRFDYWKSILIALIPTGAIGYFLYKFVKQFLLGNPGIVIISLFGGGILMLILDNYFNKVGRNKEIEKLTAKDSLIIGFWQAVSIIPGVSRAMTTIYGGMGTGLTRKAATEFSFLLAIPTMAVAAAFDLIKTGFNFSPGEYGIMAVGLIGSCFSAMLTVKILINFVQKHDFKIFAYYRIVLAVIFWLTLGV